MRMRLAWGRALNERRSEKPHDVQNPATEAVEGVLDGVNAPTTTDTTGLFWHGGRV